LQPEAFNSETKKMIFVTIFLQASRSGLDGQLSGQFKLVTDDMSYTEPRRTEFSCGTRALVVQRAVKGRI
jgi:hypothetical protein